VDSLSRPPLFVGYDQLATWVDALSPRLADEGFVAVVGVLRGGGLPALWLSFALDLPVYFVRHDRSRQETRWDGELPPPGKVLLCEDFAGSGWTLVHAQSLVARTHEFKTLTLVHDALSRTKPEWSRHFGGGRVVLPWERHCHTARHASYHEGGHPSRPDADFRVFGIDLDGVFCNDLPPSSYESNLEACLNARDLLPMLPTAPRLDSLRHVLITGRPRCDAQRTHRWLARHGMPGTSVYFRDESVHDAAASHHHKGLTATALGCSDFIESCPRQSLELAAAYPHLRVFWWNEGHPVLLNASDSKAPLPLVGQSLEFPLPRSTPAARRSRVQGGPPSPGHIPDDPAGVTAGVVRETKIRSPSPSSSVSARW
jgi:hypoxanthine phosphoribosyltransferase